MKGNAGESDFSPYNVDASMNTRFVSVLSNSGMLGSILKPLLFLAILVALTFGVLALLS